MGCGGPRASRGNQSVVNFGPINRCREKKKKKKTLKEIREMKKKSTAYADLRAESFARNYSERIRVNHAGNALLDP